MRQFDLTAQQMTKENEMRKDIKCLAQTVQKMDKAIEEITKELKDILRSAATKIMLPLPLLPEN